MRTLLCALLLVSVAGTAVADPVSVYESIDDVSIGPLFLTPAERRWLDARRNTPDAPELRVMTELESSVAAEPAAPKASPAGFIIRSDGAGQRWSNGDFVSSRGTPVRAMKFPGEVELVRHDDGGKTRRAEDPKHVDPADQ